MNRNDKKFHMCWPLYFGGKDFMVDEPNKNDEHIVPVD